MKNLRLRLDMLGDEPLGTTHVMASIFPVGTKLPAERRRELRDFPIPAGDEPGRWENVRLPPGRYEVQVSLPSGDVLTDDVSLTPDGPSDVEHAMEARSPRETLAMQHFQGNVGNRDDRRPDPDWVVQSLDLGGTDSPRRHLSRHGGPDAGVAFDPAGAEDALDVAWCSAEPTAGDAWRLVAGIIRDGDTPAAAIDAFWRGLPTREPRPAAPGHREATAQVFRFHMNGPVQGSGVATPSWRDVQGTLDRRYVLVRDDASARLVCAPSPWNDLEGDRELSFEIMSPLGSAGVTTVVRDTQLGSIIGYLTSNSLGSARKLVDRAQGMLFGKIKNPLGAAAGAYVMLSTENSRERASWHHWIDNLCRWFEWMPDGAIARATMKLNHQRCDEDVDEALEGFAEAYRRGLPFYTLGMRWLLDGLTAFAEDDAREGRRDEIEAMLQDVRTVARRTNYQQPFTSIALTRPR